MIYNFVALELKNQKLYNNKRKYFKKYFFFNNERNFKTNRTPCIKNFFFLKYILKKKLEIEQRSASLLPKRKIEKNIKNFYFLIIG